MAEMTDEELSRAINTLVKDAEAYRQQVYPDRQRAQEYCDGVMNDTPSDDGRSKVVSRDVRGEIKKVLPSVVRIILGNEKVVEYQPNAQGDEAQAEQATDYVNFLIFPESDGPNAVHDVIDDALRLRNGIIKWWQDKRIEVKYSEHTGLDDMAFAQLVGDDDVEVLAHTERSEEIAQPDGQPVEVPVHDVKIRRKTVCSRPKLAAVAPENFLIHPDALTMLDSPIIGENYRVRRSDLVAMGYERAKVDALPMATANSTEQDAEEITRRRNVWIKDDPASKSMQEIEYYELLVRLDVDGDGIAELRRMVFAGGLTPDYMLENEPWDEINYADIVCERRPHQWEGNSVFDDTEDIQRIKTVLLRQTLDNLYWQNNQQPIVQEGQVVNPEAVTSPVFGLPIRIKPGVDVRTALGFNVVPFVADKSYQMLAYLDEEKHDRTGISDASSGMAPDALQNMTAKASAMVEQAGIGQTELMVRTIANCLKPVFRGLLKLIIQHQDKPRMVRLRNQWVTFDPRTWNADMDCTVNTGLGAGTRERDMMMMQTVIMMQEKLLAAFGPNNPFVKPDQLYNAVSKIVEAAGLKSPDLYFTKPDPNEVKALLEQQANKPSPEQEKTQGQLQIEQAKGQVQLQLADKKMQVDASREQQQRDADLVIKQAELEKETQAKMHDAQLKAQSDADKLAIEREKIASQERIAMSKLQADIALKREEMDRADARAEKDREASVQQAQAASIGRAFERDQQRAAAQ
jgi:hypothetical protein